MNIMKERRTGRLEKSGHRRKENEENHEGCIPCGT